MPSSNPAFSRFGGAGNGQQNPWGAQPQQYGAPGQYGAPTQYDPYAVCAGSAGPCRGPGGARRNPSEGIRDTPERRGAVGR